MSVALRNDRISHEEYLEGEKVSEIKHEYICGEVFAMSGASKAHVRLTMNMVMEMGASLRGGPCDLFAVDLKVFVEAADCYFYPDLVVSCDQRDRRGDKYYLKHPKIIIEVLSPSTETYDRVKKFASYRKLDSLEEYILIAQDRQHIEHFTREGHNHWTLHILGPDDDLKFKGIDLTIKMQEIYEDVMLKAEEEALAKEGETMMSDNED